MEIALLLATAWQNRLDAALDDGAQLTRELLDSTLTAACEELGLGSPRMIPLTLTTAATLQLVERWAHGEELAVLLSIHYAGKTDQLEAVHEDIAHAGTGGGGLQPSGAMTTPPAAPPAPPPPVMPRELILLVGNAVRALEPKPGYKPASRAILIEALKGLVRYELKVYGGQE